MINCPKCGSRFLRSSTPRDLSERLGKLRFREPMRCGDCGTRFIGSTLGWGEWRYARCPECLRMDLNVWTGETYRPTAWMSVKLAFGAGRYRCEYCRLHFASFRKRQEVFSFRRWEKLGLGNAESESGERPDSSASGEPEERPSAEPRLERETSPRVAEAARKPKATRRRRGGSAWIRIIAFIIIVAAALGGWVFKQRRTRQLTVSSTAGSSAVAPAGAVNPAVAGNFAALKPGAESKGATRVNPSDGLTYVYLPAGTFMMGCSPEDTECESDEKPPRAEQIANGFWLGQTEVTQAAWKKVKGGAGPSLFKGDQLPVDNVSWVEADSYCKAIGGRLPSEKEWEYAARAGSTGAMYGPLEAIAWYSGNSAGATHPAGSKQANGWGLYDMLGNVWEWTSDNYIGERKVLRGGSWHDGLIILRVSYRDRSDPTTQSNLVGFRCAA